MEELQPSAAGADISGYPDPVAPARLAALFVVVVFAGVLPAGLLAALRSMCVSHGQAALHCTYRARFSIVAERTSCVGSLPTCVGL